MRSPLLLLAALGCTSPELDETSAHATKSDDAEQRAAAADDLLESGTLAELEPLLKDPEPRVREQAVLTYGLLGGRDAIQRLREIARNDNDQAVVAAALASLDRIAEAFPEPARGWLDVQYPDKVFAGIPFPVHVKLGSKVEVPHARVVLQLPPMLRVLDAKQPPIWEGSLEADRTVDTKFELVATKDGRAGVRVHLTLDFKELLDIEKHHDRVRVAIENGHGHFEPLPAETVRKP